MQIKPEQIISALRIGIKDASFKFTSGGCFQLYLVLKELYPSAVCWYDGNHVYTEIEGCFYDINGFHEKKESWYKLKDNEPIIYAKAHDWDYLTTRGTHHENSNFIKRFID